MAEKLYRSTDGAKTWVPTFDKPVGQILIHPRSSEVLLVAEETSSPYENGLWKSVDKGKSFNRIADFPFPLENQLFFDPVNSQILYNIGYLDNTNVLLISRNGGKSWQRNSVFPKRYQGCSFTQWYFNDLLVSPFNRKVLYATAITACADEFEEFLLHSEDRGLRWKILQRLPTGVYESVNTRFHFDSAFPHRAFLSGDNGLRILTPNGWTLIADTPPLGNLASVPKEPQHLFSNNYGRLYETRNEGLSWEKVRI